MRNNRFGGVFIFLFFGVLFLTGCTPSYDLIIKNGTLIDGTGLPSFTSDIGITGGKIITIGTLRERAAQTIDAEGLYVTPGFIDLHTHCDSALIHDKLKQAANYLTQGVTTVVTGNCGGGTYEVEEYFKRLEKQGIGPNVIHLIGHGTVRRAVLGMEDREPTSEELGRMKTLLEQGMNQGAWGFSTGLFYAPGSYARTDEIIELARTVNKKNGIYATHLRDESSYTTGLLESVKEAIRIGEESGIPVEISHIKALGRPVWGKPAEVCALIENARQRGVKVFADQYPYTASSTALAAAVIPRWIQADGQMINRLKDPALQSKIREEIGENINRRGGPESLVIVSFPKNQEFAGKSLLEISRILDRPVVDTAIYLILNGAPGVISFNMNESDLEFFMTKDYVSTGSDGTVQLPGMNFSHPRSYGTFIRKIRKYAIEKNLISLEFAIRAATALPSEVLNLSDRGRLKENHAADIIIFDLEQITDKATYQAPHEFSEGIRHLLINGEYVIKNGRLTNTLAGIPLKMGSGKPAL
ncbi:amidohydrolase family protein [Acidobacteriota bacterium]